jgi:hypothetical protein
LRSGAHKFTAGAAASSPRFHEMHLNKTRRGRRVPKGMRVFVFPPRVQPGGDAGLHLTNSGAHAANVERHNEERDADR